MFFAGGERVDGTAGGSSRGGEFNNWKIWTPRRIDGPAAQNKAPLKPAHAPLRPRLSHRPTGWCCHVAAHLRPVKRAVVLGASLHVGVVHEGKVSQSGVPLGGGLLSRAALQQAYGQVGSVVVLKGDGLDLKGTLCKP